MPLSWSFCFIEGLLDFWHILTTTSILDYPRMWKNFLYLRNYKLYHAFFFLFRKEQAVVWRNVRWEHGYCWALTVMAGLWLGVPWAACVLLQPLALLSAEWWFLYPAVWNLKQRKKVLLTVDTVEPMEVCSYNWLSFSPECDSPCAFSVGLLFSPIGLKRALRVYWLISEIKWALDSEGMLWKLLLLVLLITVYELFK